MEFISYDSFGNFNFSDTYIEVQKKLGDIKYQVGEKEFLGKRKKTIYVDDFEMLITFSEKANKVESFEIDKGQFIHFGKNLLREKFDKVQSEYSQLDKEIKIDEEGFESKKFGFGVSRKLKYSEYTNEIDTIFAFSKEYADSNNEYDVDDIISFYLGE